MFILFLAVIIVLILGTSKWISLNRLTWLTDIGHCRNSISKVWSNSSGNHGKLCGKTPEGDKEEVTGVRETPKNAERPDRTWQLSQATIDKEDVQKDTLYSSLCRRAQPPLQAVSTQSKTTAGRALWHKTWMEYSVSIYLPDVSQSLALVFVEGLTDVCWKLNNSREEVVWEVPAECGRELPGAAGKWAYKGWWPTRPSVYI